ncbi:MAG TPA: hypothetical protein VGE36_04855 [Roseateles sp.]
MKTLQRSLLCASALVASFGLVAVGHAAPVIKLKTISTAFSNPVGIDYYEPTNELILSSHYPSGLPSNLERVSASGAHSIYSSLSGATDELKIATVRSGYATGFAVGTTFTGNGADGQIVKVDPGGGTTVNPWVTLPGGGHGVFRGSLYVDRTGVYGGDLIAATTAGEVWRVNAAGTATMIADVGVHLEGLATVPNDVGRWGAIAGCIIAGAEGQGLMHAWCPSASGGYSHTTHSLGVAIEDIDFIDGGNFFGVNYGTGQLLGADAAQFAGMEGDILLTQEFPVGGGSGLFRMTWTGSALAVEQFGLDLTDVRSGFGQWEHVTFANAGVVEIPPVGRLPEPAGLVLAAVLALACTRRRR